VKALKHLCEKNRATVVEFEKNIDLVELSRSSRFDAVMAAFPDLKERFLLAASRDKMSQSENPLPLPDAGKPKRQGGFHI